MVLLNVTTYGWAVLAMMVLAVLMAVKILKRTSGRAGAVGISYVSIIVFVLLICATTLGNMLAGFIYNVTTLPKYEARVVEVNGRWDRDSKGRRAMIYTPIVSFRNANGAEVRLKTDMASGARPDIGEIIRVGYSTGMDVAEEISLSKYMLIGGAGVMLLLIGYFLFGGIYYAMGKNMSRYFVFGKNLVMGFIMPLGMLLLLGGMGYALFLYFSGQKPDMPMWAVVVCGFFSVMLFFSFIGYIRSYLFPRWESADLNQ